MPGEPNVSSEAIPAPDLPESRIDLRVAVQMATIRAEVESNVPMEVGAGDYNESINGGRNNCEGHGVSAGWKVTRQPFNVTFVGSTLSFGVEIQYDLAGQAKLDLLIGCGPTFTGSCGRGSEPRRRANLGISAELAVLPDWTLQANTQTQVTPIDRCTVTFVDVDITDRIMEAAKRALDSKVENAKGALRALPVRAKAELAWTQLQKPAQLRPGVWLTINPTSVALQPLSFIGDELVAGIQVRAKPRVSLAAKAPAAQPSPLPPVTQAPVGDSFLVAAPVDLTFAEASAQLRKALHAAEGGLRVPPVGDQHVVLRDAEVFGSGSTLVLRIAFDGTVKGQLYFVGAPSFDAAAGSVSVKDLDFSVETKNILLKSANWLLHSDLREQLAERAQFDLRPLLADAKKQISGVLTYRSGDFDATANLENFRVLTVAALPKEKLLRAEVMLSGDVKTFVK